MLAAIALVIQSLVPTPPVFINHFSVTVDPATFKAITKSQWLRKEFGKVNVSTHSNGSDTWTGCYVMGVGSYVELFSADKNNKEGSAGIGFATPMAGGADNVYTNFRASAFGKRAVRDEMNLGSVKKQLPFAHIATYDGQDNVGLYVWLMEFHQDFYARLGLPVGVPYSQVMAAYAKRDHKVYQGMMGDVISITARPTGDQKDLRLALDLMGFKRVGDSNTYRHIPDSVDVLPPLPSGSHYGITSVTFSLRRSPKVVHVERFSSHCVLTAYPDGHAEWRFR